MTIGKMTSITTILCVMFFQVAAAIAQPGASQGGGAPAAQGAASSKTEVISSISFSGNEKFSDEQLLEASGIKVGGAMSQEIIGGAIKSIIAFYKKNGANLSISPNIQPNGGKPIIEFVIDESGDKGDAGAFEPGGTSPGGTPPPAGEAK